jgi:hypothetical protein
MSQNIGTLITASIRPNDSSDLIASAIDNELKGTHHSYDTLTQRDAIITARRSWGMFCTVNNDAPNNGTYQLVRGHIDTDITNNANWTSFSGSGSSTTTVMWASNGSVTVGTDVASTFIVPFSATLIKAYAYAGTAPTGANLIVDINKNGTTIWTTQANRLTINAGDSSASQTAFDVTSLTEFDRLSLDIDQVGSIIPGSDLTITLKVSL